MTWQDDQEFEKEWWGNCSNTFTEEVKQLTYAYKMGLEAYSDRGKWPCYNLDGKRVLDIGGGPVSILLKCQNLGDSTVLDPCRYPSWIRERYSAAGIEYIRGMGENFSDYPDQYDEVWIYNVLQHTKDPEAIIKNAIKAAPTIRIFEWIDMPPQIGHPQELKEDDLNRWLGGVGTTEWLNENNCQGRSYYGVFTA